MKRKAVQRNVSFRFVTSSSSGILRTSARSYGTFITPVSTKERVFGCFRTELDIWQYIRLENIPIVPLYYAKERPVVNIDGQLIMPDDDRLPEKYRDKIEMKKIRFRTLGCWPLTGAIESEADTIEKIVEEMMTTTKSERTTRVIDFDQEASMEQKKREGYF